MYSFYVLLEGGIFAKLGDALMFSLGDAACLCDYLRLNGSVWSGCGNVPAISHPI